MPCSLYVNYAAGQWYSAQTFASGIMTEVVFKFANALQISSAAPRVNHFMNRVLEA